MSDAPLISLKYHPRPEEIPTIEFPEDVARFRGILNARGFDAEDIEIHRAWTAYSDGFAAYWLTLWKDDEAVFRFIRTFLTEV